MKINLRNKAGQFCNFAEFAKEKPSACVGLMGSPKGAAGYIEGGRKDLRELKQLAEIISVMNLPQYASVWHEGLEIRSDGKWSGPGTVEIAIERAEERMRHNERLAAIWTMDSYEIED